MYFKKIDMHGFKSFADPVTIEFNQGLTGIVGPNGSGKSNISDAIRWVLGEQSPKTLRGGKMEEVIFSGTDTRKSRGMAEVTLVIDNNDGSLPIDYQEVAITRRMFRSGESEYYINGNQCRLRDIRELIMDTGIGVDGYSLIGQGKIADIISNKIESRREIFEEAAGIVAYRTKKAESERKLASTRDNMDRVQDIIGEIEGRIDTLREDSIKAKEYIKLRDRHRELEINIILKNVEGLELKTEYAKDDLAELDVLLTESKEARGELDGKLAEAGAKRDNLEEIENKTREKLLAAIDELNAVVNKSDVDKERLSAIEENEERLADEIYQLEERKGRESENAENFLKQKAAIDEEAEEANKNLEARVFAYNEMAGEMARLSEEADKWSGEVFELSSAVNSGKAEINSLSMLQETLERRKNQLISERDDGESSNRQTLDNLNSIRKEREEMAQALEHDRAAAKERRQKIQNDQMEERNLAKASEELRISLGQLRARKRTIEEMESNYEGYNYAVKHVMKSGLPGIRKVVAEAIQVPEGYEIAIETALGASLQNIICDDEASAKRAIRSLKENRAGRMTFLPLTAIHGRTLRDEKLRSEKGFKGFGPDCISFDEEYTAIMEYLLGQVVIVDDLDNAVEISRKARGMRVVTLDGEIINSSGAMTGGKYKNKTANILDRKAEIASLGRLINDQQKEQDRASNKLQQLRDGIEKAAEEIGALEGKIRGAEHELLLKENEIQLAETALKDIRNASDKLSKELENIENEQANSRKMIGEIQAQIEKNEAAIKEAEAKSQEIAAQHDGKKDAFDELSEEITKARIAVTSCDDRKAHADDLVERIESTIAQIERDLQIRKEQLEAMKEEKESLTSGHGDMDGLIKEKEEAKQRIEDYLTEVAEEKATLVAEINGMNAEKDEHAAKLESLQNQKYDLDIRMAKMETQLEGYKEKLWEDFEVSYVQAMEFKAEKFAMSPAIKENRQIKNRMKELGEVNIGAIEEYETVRERYEFLTAQQADIQEAMDNLIKIINDIDKTIRERFKASFDQIVVNFEKKFQELFGGGHAELRLSDESNPLESSIDIVAQPPGKKLQNINLLSGGEKTLTAIALMFAVLEAKPTPFCILDEVEAALDEPNIDRFIHTLREFRDIQFTLVTHQRATMEQADVLYGVTMPEKGVSKVLSLSLEDNLDAYSN